MQAMQCTRNSLLRLPSELRALLCSQQDQSHRSGLQRCLQSQYNGYTVRSANPQTNEYASRIHKQLADKATQPLRSTSAKPLRHQLVDMVDGQKITEPNPDKASSKPEWAEFLNYTKPSDEGALDKRKEFSEKIIASRVESTQASLGLDEDTYAPSKIQPSGLTFGRIKRWQTHYGRTSIGQRRDRMAQQRAPYSTPSTTQGTEQRVIRRVDHPEKLVRRVWPDHSLHKSHHSGLSPGERDFVSSSLGVAEEPPQHAGPPQPPLAIRRLPLSGSTQRKLQESSWYWRDAARLQSIRENATQSLERSSGELAGIRRVRIDVPEGRDKKNVAPRSDPEGPRKPKPQEESVDLSKLLSAVDTTLQSWGTARPRSAPRPALNAAFAGQVRGLATESNAKGGERAQRESENKQERAENQPNVNGEDTQKDGGKSIAQRDHELMEKMAGRVGDGGEAGVEYEDGQPVAMKRSVKNNMFRYI